MSRIGIDFDNTLVGYDAVFWRAARERELVPDTTRTSKLAVRDHLRRTGREAAWTLLQGDVYGARMAEAAAFPGALEVLLLARQQGHRVFIVSHRTRTPAAGPPHDLHRAARAWVEQNLVRDGAPLVAADDIHFEATREEKVARIAALACDVFVDDLPELLLSTDFPARTRRVLFDPDGAHTPAEALETIRHWSELPRLLEG